MKNPFLMWTRGRGAILPGNTLMMQVNCAENLRKQRTAMRERKLQDVACSRQGWCAKNPQPKIANCKTKIQYILAVGGDGGGVKRKSVLCKKISKLHQRV